MSDLNRPGSRAEANPSGAQKPRASGEMEGAVFSYLGIRAAVSLHIQQRTAAEEGVAKIGEGGLAGGGLGGVRGASRFRFADAVAPKSRSGQCPATPAAALQFGHPQ